MPELTFKKPVAQLRLQRIREMLAERPMTLHEISDRLHVNIRWVRCYVNHLHSSDGKEKEVYVKEWPRVVEGRDRRFPTRLFALGNKRDAKKPKRDSSHVRYKRHMAKVRADEDLNERHLAKRRVNRRIRRATPDPASAWIKPIGEQP